MTPYQLDRWVDLDVIQWISPAAITEHKSSCIMEFHIQCAFRNNSDDIHMRCDNRLETEQTYQNFINAWKSK